MTREEVEALSLPEQEELFDEFLDDTNDPVVLMGVHYDYSRVVKEVDPLYYDTELTNYIDMLAEDE